MKYPTATPGAGPGPPSASRASGSEEVGDPVPDSFPSSTRRYRSTRALYSTGSSSLDAFSNSRSPSNDCVFSRPKTVPTASQPPNMGNRSRGLRMPPMATERKKPASTVNPMGCSSDRSTWCCS